MPPPIQHKPPPPARPAHHYKHRDVVVGIPGLPVFLLHPLKIVKQIPQEPHCTGESRPVLAAQLSSQTLGVLSSGTQFTCVLAFKVRKLVIYLRFSDFSVA